VNFIIFMSLFFARLEILCTAHCVVVVNCLFRGSLSVVYWQGISSKIFKKSIKTGKLVRPHKENRKVFGKNYR